VNAGEPTHEEIARRTGRLLDSKTVRNILSGPVYYFWSEWHSTPILLSALGLSDEEIDSWRRVRDRLRRKHAISKLPSFMAATATVTGIALIAGATTSQAGTSPAIGAGNWWALSISAVFILLGAKKLTTRIKKGLGPRPHRAGKFLFVTFYFLFLPACFTSSLICASILKLELAGRVVWNLMVWRF
jgi:hypothetical protein